MTQSRNQTDSAIKQAISEAMGGGSPVLMFYDGISMPVFLKDGKSPIEFGKFIKRSARGQIQDAKRRGITKNDMIETCKDFLDIIHYSIKSRMKDGKLDCCSEELFDIDCPILGSSSKVSAMWYLNTEILLQLKAINNDDKNGWLFIHAYL